MFVHVYVFTCACSMLCMWRSEGNFTTLMVPRFLVGRVANLSIYTVIQHSALWVEYQSQLAFRAAFSTYGLQPLWG